MNYLYYKGSQTNDNDENETQSTRSDKNNTELLNNDECGKMNDEIQEEVEKVIQHDNDPTIEEEPDISSVENNYNESEDDVDTIKPKEVNDRYKITHYVFFKKTG